MICVLFVLLLAGIYIPTLGDMMSSYSSIDSNITIFGDWYVSQDLLGVICGYISYPHFTSCGIMRHVMSYCVISKCTCILRRDFTKIL